MKNAAMLVLVLAMCSSAWAATIEFQGPNGATLGTGSNWYILTDAGNPASRTGATRMPVKYLGDYPGTMGDDAIIRNGTTTTLSTLLEAQRLYLGSPLITNQPTAGMTTMYIQNGATISLYSGDANDDPEAVIDARMSIGGNYNATVTMNGGLVDISSRAGQGLYLATAGAGTGILNMNGGTIRQWAPIAGLPRVQLGSQLGGYAQLNQSGGLIKMDGDTDAGNWAYIGIGSRADYNMTGGTFSSPGTVRIGTEDTDVVGTGVFTQTGGLFEYHYRVLVGDGNRQDANVGHLRLLGGTFRHMNYGGHDGHEIWLGRGSAETAYAGAVGKLTINQSAVLDANLIMGRDGIDAVNSQMELKINSAANFQMDFENWCLLGGGLEVSLTNGYVPTVGQEWRMATLWEGSPYKMYALNFLTTTPGFRAEQRGLETWLVCTGIKHAGDANNDGKVNVGDLGILAGNWGQVTALGKSWAEGDFNGDDVVNVGDLGILAGAWGWIGTPAAATAVPEPASLVLLTLGGLAMLRRRK